MSKDERHKTKVPFALRLLPFVSVAKRILCEASLSSYVFCPLSAKQREASLISLKHIAGVYLFGNVFEAAVVTVGDDSLRA